MIDAISSGQESKPRYLGVQNYFSSENAEKTWQPTPTRTFEQASFLPDTRETLAIAGEHSCRVRRFETASAVKPLRVIGGLRNWDSGGAGGMH